MTSCYCLLLSALTAALPWIPGTQLREGYAVTETTFFFIFLACIPLYWAILYGKGYLLTDEGITQYFFGIRWRKTGWDGVRDVMVLPTSDRGGGKGMLVTVDGGVICRPKEERNKYGQIECSTWVLCCQNKKMLLTRITGHNFFINCGAMMKKWPELVSFMEAHFQGEIYYAPVQEPHVK